MTKGNILRTTEAIYGLPKSGAQQPNALRARVSDDATRSSRSDSFAAREVRRSCP